MADELYEVFGLEIRVGDTVGTLVAANPLWIAAVRDDVKRAKSLPLKDLAEREGFEPSVQVLARTTV